MAEMSYLTILGTLYRYTDLRLADAGLSATSSLESAGMPLNYQAADEVAFRLTAATAIIGKDWDDADAAVRRMLLHVAELPSGTLQYLQQSVPAKRQSGN
ncbi:MAG TPA: hypothetical protein VGP33_14965 [Chloroflexota bacterium]|jgi:hypothetical protein|nr:hypothetical protein [Chloroflexota bacterium]